MKIALVQPNFRRSVATGGYVFRVNPPLGICYLSAVLKQNGFQVDVVDANAMNLTKEETAEKVKGYDIVGVSILSPAYTWSVDFIKLLPKNVLKVAGNAHPTGYWKEALEDGFDVVAIGEGEFTMLEIAQGKPLKDILGIAYKDETIHKNPPRPFIENPDVLPFPDRECLMANGMDLPYLGFMTQKTPCAPILTSRSCPYNCYFCNKLVFGRGWRPRSAENVFSEIKILYEKYGAKEIDITDDAFNIDMDRAKKICDMIIESGMKLAGCNYIAYGIESGNQKILDKIPKCETLEQIEEAFRLTNKYGIKSSAFIIFGLEGDTEETMQDTIDFTKKVKPDYVSASMVSPYPGTKLYDKIKKDGKFVVPEDWSYFSHTNPKMLFEHPDFPSPELTEKMFKKFFREFYLNPRFIIKNMFSIRSWFDIRQSLIGLYAILKISFFRKSSSV
jgi:anaerobic magnesium-protoporphyrin IX monomethyl ester cyclase